MSSRLRLHAEAPKTRPVFIFLIPGRDWIFCSGLPLSDLNCQEALSEPTFSRRAGTMRHVLLQPP